MKWLYALSCLLVITTGCSENVESGENSNIEHIQRTVNEEQKTVVEEQYKMPIDMPTDFNFSVSFGYDEHRKNEINTFNDTVTKDLITKGETTAELMFSLEEMYSIYEKMREINVMEMKELSSADLGCQKTPYSEDRWEISLGEKTTTLTWSDKHCVVSEEAKQLLELRIFIHNIVETKETYKELPEAEGGYD